MCNALGAYMALPQCMPNWERESGGSRVAATQLGWQRRGLRQRDAQAGCVLANTF